MATTTTKTATATDSPKLGAIRELEATADTLNLALDDIERVHRALADIRRNGLANGRPLSDADRLGIIKEARELRQLAAFISQRAEDLEGAALY